MIADDQLIRQLNADFRDKDAVTDVLSFPAAEPLVPQLLGDVVVSLEQAARQAPAGDLESELLRLFVHGVCHLRGLDHHRVGDAATMLAEEQRLLAPLAIDPLLGRSAADWID